MTKHWAQAGGPQAFLRDVAFTYEGDECLLWPFSRNSAGYPKIKRGGKSYLVSRIVCEKANGPAPTPQHEAAHSCGHGDRGCLTKKHLSWKTRAENESDKVGHGTSPHGKRPGNSRLSESDVRRILADGGRTKQRELAARFGVSQTSIANVLLRKTWTDIPAPKGGA